MLFRSLRTLREAGYRGPVGLQCFGIGGDTRVHLEKSMAAWRRIRVAAGEPIPVDTAELLQPLPALAPA